MWPGMRPATGADGELHVDAVGDGRIVGADLAQVLRRRACQRPRPSISATPGLLAGSEEVEIDPDGRELAGRLFGSGDVGVVLAHGNRPGLAQPGMSEVAAKLADAGYTAPHLQLPKLLPADRSGRLLRRALRGEHPVPRRHFGGVILQERGIETIFVVGSSLGGTNALYAAAQPGVEPAGPPTIPDTSRLSVGEP